jgi:hypothetical protein
MGDDAGRRWVGGETALGGLLVLLGIAVLLGQAFQLELGRVAWPVFVIVPGLGLLGLGLAAAGRLGEVLATVGGVVTMAGLVLLVQNATDRFETWAYAWTLMVLVGAGIGRWLVGVVRGRRDLAASGGWLIAAGLAGFLVFAVFFEVVIGVGGRGYGVSSRYALAALLILAAWSCSAVGCWRPGGREVRPAAASKVAAGTHGSRLRLQCSASPDATSPTIPIGSHAHDFDWSWDATQWHRPISMGQVASVANSSSAFTTDLRGAGWKPPMTPGRPHPHPRHRTPLLVRQRPRPSWRASIRSGRTRPRSLPPSTGACSGHGR